MDMHLENVIEKALEKNLLTDEQPSLVSQFYEYCKNIIMVFCRIFLTLTTSKEELSH